MGSSDLQLGPCIPHTQTGQVYVIWMRGTDFVKVGFTRGNPAARVSGLQTGNPFKLDLLGSVTGTVADERSFHERFDLRRTVGEWFWLDDELEATLAIEFGVYVPEARILGNC